MGENDGINYTSSSASFGMAGCAKTMSFLDSAPYSKWLAFGIHGKSLIPEEVVKDNS